MIGCGEIRPGDSLPFAERLHRLHVGIEAVVLSHRPDSAAVESPFHGASARSALQLAHARGVILAVLGGAGIQVAEYAPATVKKAVAGNGRAEKAQVRAMVLRLLGCDLPSESTDLSDALAVALCHLSSGRFRSIVDASVQRGRARG